MNCGWPSLCLDVRDLDASARFYEAVGLQRLEEVSAPGRRLILRSGGFRLGLFRGIDGNCLNIRGADVPALHASLRERLPGLEGEPRHYVAESGSDRDAPGCSWLTRDPDGNAVFFDTNANEVGEAYRKLRTRQILSDAVHALERVDADPRCLQALRTQVIDRFCEP